MIFIGCDGGSTKTEWLLCNERGRVLAHRTFSGCNCAFLGEDGFARLMADSAESLLADAGINAADVASAMFALTGYGEIPGTLHTIAEESKRLGLGRMGRFSGSQARYQRGGRNRVRGLWKRSAAARLPCGRVVPVFCR